MDLSGFDNKAHSLNHISNWFDENQCNALFSQSFSMTCQVSFFIKDREHRLVMVNNGFFQGLDYPSRNYFGKTDLTFPARLAEHFRRDDREIFRNQKTQIKYIGIGIQ